MKCRKKILCMIIAGLVIMLNLSGPAVAQMEGDEGSGLISIAFREADIQDVLRALGEIGNVNIVAGKEVTGTVTVQLKDVALEDALEAILSVNGFQYRWKNNIILVEKGEEIFNSEVIPLNFANADEAKEMIEKLVSEKGDVKVHERLNELIITDYDKNIDRMKSLIERIDQPPLQVRIETKIIKMAVGDIQELGIRWQASYSNLKPAWQSETDADGNAINENWTTDDQDDVKFEKGIATFDIANPAGVNSASLDGGVFNIAELATIGDKIRIGAAIDALIQDQKANVLSSPNITTLNNKQASIVIGEKVGIREQTQTTTGTTESVRFEDVGIKLYVTPKIARNGYITMHIKPEISTVEVYTETQQRFSTTQAETYVRVKDEHTVIIGGLIQDDETKSVRKIPFLGSIPILGLPFRHKDTSRTKSELVIFLTPSILKDGIFETKSIMADATDYEAKRDLESKAKENEMLEKFSAVKKADDIRDYTKDVDEQKEEARRLYKEARELETLGCRVKDERRQALFNKAIAYYLQVGRDYKDMTKYSPESLYRAARIYYKYLELYGKAELIFDEIVQEYPETRYAKKALKYLRKIRKSSMQGE